ncbi:MAG: anaerobic ribonucleoside-triphosphate reductase activating protein [Anaerovorax sp.]
MESPKNALRLAGIVRESIVDGPGLRFVVFAQGCPHHCQDCHNQGTHDFQGGFDCSAENVLKEMDKNPLLAGVTFSGGEPFCQSEAFYELALKVKERKLHLLAFSGYTLDELLEMSSCNPWIAKLLGCIDTLIDGPFIAEEKDLTLQFRGSKNQRYVKKEEIQTSLKKVLYKGK